MERDEHRLAVMAKALSETLDEIARLDTELIMAQANNHDLARQLREKLEPINGN
jgi:hypothetical protein